MTDSYSKMAVQKYKPKRTPHDLDRRVNEAAKQSARAVQSAKKAVAESKKIVMDSRETIRRIQKRKP